MAKMTQEMRHQLRRHLLQQRFGDVLKDLQEREHRLTLDVYYNLMYDTEARMQMEALPEGWLPTTRRLTVRVDGRWTYLELDHQHYGVHNVSNYQPTHLKLRVTFDQYQGNHSPELCDPWRRQREDLVRERAEAEAEITTTDARIKHLLARYRTTRGLAEGWPEVAPIVSELFKTKGPIQAPDVSGLSEALGLVP